MMPEKKYISQIFPATNTPFDLRLQYGTLRYNSFQADDPFLNLNHTNKVEFDKFDERESTLYVMVWLEGVEGKKRQLMSATRLIPTLLEYDLEAPSWSYITDGINLPKSKEIFEYSRDVSFSHPRNDHDACIGLIGMELYDLGQRLGVEKFLGVGASGQLEYMRMSGMTITSLSPPISAERDEQTLELYVQDIDSALMANSYQLYTRALNAEPGEQLPMQAANS